jgi:RNA polymerase sigma-70 factor, ECF subfamily
VAVDAGGAMNGVELSDPVDLVAAVAERRDRQAFAALFDLYAPRLKTYLRRGGASEETAEDLVQEVMLVVWQRAASYDPARATPATWIFTLARNRRIDQLRRERRFDPEPLDPRALDEGEAASGVDGVAERRDWYTFVVQEVAKLPPEQADVLRWIFLDDKPHRTVARERNLPLGTVKSRARLALRRLRATLNGQW